MGKARKRAKLFKKAFSSFVSSSFRAFVIAPDFSLSLYFPCTVRRAPCTLPFSLYLPFPFYYISATE
jgi:hypothetical protein